MRADGREADDVAVRTNAARDFAAELQQDAWRIRVGIGDLQGGVGFEVAHVREAVYGIAQPRERRAGFRPLRDNGRGGRARRGDSGAGQGTSVGRNRLCDRTCSCVSPLLQ